MPVKYWEDYELGEKSVTDSVTVTETHVVNWAGLTMDFYALHMDKEFAAKTVFKERIAHGPLIFALGVGLSARMNNDGQSVIAWMGIDNMRMLQPVKIGDTITVHIEVAEKKETKSAKQGITIMKYSVHNQKDEVVMVYYSNLLMHRRG